MAEANTNVTNQKHFLDHEGLVELIKQIKTADKVVATTAQTNLVNLVGALGNKVEASEGVEAVAHTVKSYVDTKVAAANTSAEEAIKALDSSANSNSLTTATGYTPANGETDAVSAVEANCKVYVKVTETDGKLTAVQVNTTDIASKVLLDQEIAQRQEAINALNSTVFDGQATADATEVEDGSHVAVKVVESAGMLTGVTVMEKDIASATALANLVAAVGYADGKLSETEGNAQKSTVSARLVAAETAITTLNANSQTTGSVDKKVADAIAEVVASAPEAFDTLKEIADWIGSGEDIKGTTAATMLADITKLKGANTVDGSVAKSIKDAVEGLDATVSDNVTVVENVDTVTAADKVAVKIVETDGKLDSVTVLTNDIASEASLNALTTYVGVASKAAQGTQGEEGYVAAVAATGLTKQVEALEAAVGAEGSVETQITTAIAKLDATVGSGDENSATIAEGKHVGIQIVETDGKLTGLTLNENDIASAALLGTAADDKSKATAFGAIAKEADDRATAISGLNAEITSSDDGAICTVKVTEVAGKITKVNVTNVLTPCSADDVSALFAIVNPVNQQG